ncbi:MAG TPA: AbrB/MazE/SpoVT family DNA-binding domain-containing protein [Aurantimonas sp.]
MNADQDTMRTITNGLPTKAAKIRALDERGFQRADIARFLGIRYQHVRNTLERPRAESPKMATPDRKAFTMHPEADAFTRVSVDAEGRIVIPETFRRLMKLGEGGKLIVRVDEDGELRLTSPMAAIDKVRRMIAENSFGGGSPVDELIAERRAEALRDEAETLQHLPKS